MTSPPGGPDRTADPAEHPADPAEHPAERSAERPAVVARRVGQDVTRQVGRHVTMAARRQGWRARTSAWLLLPVAGLPWVGFGYIAWKGRRPAWAGAAALHLGVSAGAVTALLSGEWWTVLGVLAAGGGWGAGVVHGLSANPRWLRLQAERAPSPSAPWLPPLAGPAGADGSGAGARRLSGPGAPTDPAERAALGQQEAAAALEVAVRAGTALPPAALPLVRQVHDAALPLLARGAGRGAPLPALDLYEVETVVGEHLPAALAQYLVLPPGYRPPSGAAGAPSPAESLLAQLRSLVELLAEVTERVHEHDARQLRVQATFLGDKVRRSDLEL